MNNIKIGIASDHRGFTAKEFLKEYFDENDRRELIPEQAEYVAGR